MIACKSKARAIQARSPSERPKDCALRLSSEAAIYAVVVDAMDDEANQFYLKYDYLAYADQSNALFLPIKQLQGL